MMLGLMTRVLELKKEKGALSGDTQKWQALLTACQALCDQDNCEAHEWNKLVGQTETLSGGADSAAAMMQLQSNAWAKSAQRTNRRRQ